uniref:Uncharacterized protein n=1 Tax=Hyaloperonospora arabidopsidis (strain Emoy2) TaxID=559515 RepID=M4BX64_HYAAE
MSADTDVLERGFTMLNGMNERMNKIKLSQAISRCSRMLGDSKSLSNVTCDGSGSRPSAEILATCAAERTAAPSTA